MTPHLDRAFTHDGLRFAYREAGAGPAIVFIHGGGSRGDHFADVIDRLAPRFRCVTYDQRGFGATAAGPDTPIDHGRWAADLGALMDHLDLARAVLCGWSLGATVALNYASRHPERVASLVLLGAPDPNRPIDRAFFARRLALAQSGAPIAEIVAQTFPAVEGNFSPWTRTHRPEVVDRVRREHLGNLPRLMAPVLDGYASRPDFGPILAKVGATLNAPIALIVGDDDRACPRAGAEALARRLPGSTIHAVANCGHYYAVEQPDTVAELIARACTVIS
ncbi:MAG: alpha/beta hydrolase [Rhodospirillaceae bacterium]|nr:alpha/beta hydrolase [Rhodospirillaceae bacterium]